MKFERNIFILSIFLVCILAISSASAAEDNADIISMDDGEALSLEESSQNMALDDSNEETVLGEASNNENLILEGNEIENALSANDENLILEGNEIENALSANDENEEDLSVNEDDTQLSAALSFTELNNLINGNNDSEIYLESDYTYSDADSDFKEGVVIDRAVTIYGNGHRLNGNGVRQARIFQVTNSSVVFRDITFCYGWADDDGGAILGKATAINCTFDNNRASSGAGMYDGTAINCTFKDNYATENGAAMCHGYAYNCTFKDNHGPEKGGAVYDIFARNCTFIENFAAYGGAMYRGTAVNCTFDSNTCRMYGQAMYEGISLNSIFTNNTNYRRVTVCTDMKFEFGDFTALYASGAKLNVALYGYPNHDIIYFTTNISIYKDGELVRTQQVTSSNGWTVNLEPGTYTATFVVPLLPEVNPKTININILKRNATLEVNSNIRYNSSEPLLIFLRDEKNNTGIANLTISVDIDGTQGNYTSNETGYISIPIDDSQLGSHEVKLKLEDHPYYNDASTNTSVTVIKRQPIIECDDPLSSGYNSSDLFTITLRDDLGQLMVGAELALDLTGETYITDENGQIKVPANKFAGGEHTAIISYNESEYWFGANRTISIQIAKQDTSISATNLTTIHGSNDKFRATLVNEQGNPITGALLTFDWTGETFITDARGQIEVPIKSLTAANYTGIIRFDGNENYTESSGTTKLIIKKEEPYISAYGTIVVYGRDAYFGVTLYDYWGNRLVGYELSNNVSDETAITDENGLARFYTTDWAAGSYAVEIRYAGNNNYTKANTTVMITVMKSRTSFNAPNVTASYDEDKNLSFTLMDVDGHPMANMPVRIYFEDILEMLTDENGQVMIPVKGMYIGKYNVKAFFDGNENYTESNTTASITIIPRETSFDATLNDDNSKAIISNAMADDGSLLNGTLYGELIRDGVKFMDLGNATVIDGEGSISIPGDLGPGIYYVSLVLKTVYGEISHNQVMFIVKAKDIIVNVDSSDIKYGEEALITFSVTDVDGNRMSGNLEVSVGEINQTVPVTDGAGELKINLSAGSYLVVATYNADDSSYIGSDTFKVEKTQTKINFKDMETYTVNSDIDGRIGEYFQITLVDEKGNPLANKPIQIGFNGKVYSRVTDSNGGAQLQINLARADIYTFAVAFLGDENYTGDFVVAKITTSKTAPKLTAPNKSYKATAKTKSLTTTLKSAMGNPIAGKAVSFTVNGKTYTGKTNANGVATVNVSLNKKGSYAVTIKYAGDSTFLAITKKATLKLT